jgi:hypothetical protein
MTPQTQAEQKARELENKCHRKIDCIQELTLLIQKSDAFDKIESMAKEGIDWDICCRDDEFIATDIFNQDKIRGVGKTLISAINKATNRDE